MKEKDLETIELLNLLLKHTEKIKHVRVSTLPNDCFDGKYSEVFITLNDSIVRNPEFKFGGLKNG